MNSSHLFDCVVLNNIWIISIIISILSFVLNFVLIWVNGLNLLILTVSILSLIGTIMTKIIIYADIFPTHISMISCSVVMISLTPVAKSFKILLTLIVFCIPVIILIWTNSRVLLLVRLIIDFNKSTPNFIILYRWELQENDQSILAHVSRTKKKHNLNSDNH